MTRRAEILQAEREELRRALAFVQSEAHVLSCVVCTTSGAVELHRDGRIVLRTPQPPKAQEGSPT